MKAIKSVTTTNFSSESRQSEYKKSFQWPDFLRNHENTLSYIWHSPTDIQSKPNIKKIPQRPSLKTKIPTIGDFRFWGGVLVYFLLKNRCFLKFDLEVVAHSELVQNTSKTPILSISDHISSLKSELPPKNSSWKFWFFAFLRILRKTKSSH